MFNTFRFSNHELHVYIKCITNCIYYFNYIYLCITLVHNDGTNGRTAKYHHLYILEDLKKSLVGSLER